MADPAKPKTAEELARVVKSCGGWCYWIAALTGVNAALMLGGSTTSFVIGTFVGQLVTFVVTSRGAALQTIALFLNLIVIGYFWAMGFFARKGARWAFGLAMAAYAVDTLLLVVIAPSLISVGFHAWALFSLFVGLSSVKAWRKAVAAEAAGKALSADQAFATSAEERKVDEAARDMEEALRRIYAEKHERRMVDPSDFRGVDHDFYERTMRWLENERFRKLGDYEIADWKNTPQDPGCFLRAAVSNDGTVTACIYHARAGKWWLRSLVWIINRGALRILELSTELSDGTLIGTSNAMLAASQRQPPHVRALYLPQDAKPAEILSRHFERVAAILQERPRVSVLTVSTLEEYFAAQNRQDAAKAAYRLSVGGMTRDELFAQARSPLARKSAELLWARMEERKRATTAAAPPLLPG